MTNILPFSFIPMLFLIILAIYILSSSVKVLREYERAVVFRLGRISKALLNPGGKGNGPGLLLLIPVIDKMVKVSLRTVAMDVPSQDTITRDNVSLKVNAVIYFRVGLEMKDVTDDIPQPTVNPLAPEMNPMEQLNPQAEVPMNMMGPNYGGQPTAGAV